ncbi:MAG: VWA domain-containing protein [Planctomycetota bacterium JB042]
MSFDQPLLLLLLPLALLPFRRRPEGDARVPFPAGAFARGIRPSWRRRGAPLAPALRALAVAAVVVALAGPRVGTAWSKVRADGIDILLALDTSVSMTTDLGERSRLEVAKEVVDRFVAGRPQDRIGLVTFAKYPRLRCPVTLDHDALRAILAEVAPVEAREERSSTAIGVALASAVLRLEGDSDRTRIVVLLTDGEESEKAVMPIEAAELARAKGIRVHAVAVTMGSRRWVDQLRDVGRATGGDGYAATDEEELRRVYERIDALERREIEERRVVEWRSLLPWAIGLALLFHLLEAPARRLLLRRIP